MVVLAVAIPTLVGSICSLIAASFIFVCYFIFPFKPHFRHVLILNLATADFINALNNTISGIWYTAGGKFRIGSKCTANGFIGQLSVQGTDFAILLIAIVTVIVLKSPQYLPNTSLPSYIFLSLLVWIVPLTTSITGLALNAYGPVSGNWCWIKADRADLRYALTHGWRIGIIFTTIGLYAYLFCYFRQVFSVEQQPSTVSIKDHDTEHIMTAMANPNLFSGNMGLSAVRNSDETDESEGRNSMQAGPFELDSISTKEQEERKRAMEEAVQDMESRDLLAAAWATNFSPYNRPGRNPTHSDTAYEPNSQTDLNIPIGDISSRAPTYATDFASMNRARNKKIQRALLLNAYPIAYVLLWLPGLINRFVELGTGESSFVLQVLQSSTQFVGVANAITYGLNERVRRRVGNFLSRHN
ncbi:hypothetical protein K504DRAFT_421848 [Pleomassaria siparia CBS 279.74]|uniref:Glucose receptor Git3-like N-terminal domain-containing protein n=1 Tax=Pleomassaria siparia CBS 279.74 TaxID=1314801 RepID=A0A6G1KQZ6_9PLEO|nr:hypothetical protein K504DRAFT_421848 [Pleomassaria siparia CBS 279.74]